MKILKLNLFQETVCYKKPFAFKVSETYPLPPYSTIIGMIHKILQAKSGEYYDMNISVQGNFESIFSNYQSLRMYKAMGIVTAMPRNVHQLLNVNLVIHIEAEDETIDKIYKSIIQGTETFTLGRNEDLVRIDGIKEIKQVTKEENVLVNRNAYIPTNKYGTEIKGINYRLNTKYIIDERNLRKWEKVDVKYVEESTNVPLEEVIKDEDGDYIYFYK